MLVEIITSQSILTGSSLHNMKHETTPIIVMRDKIMMLEEAINRVRRLSASPSKLPSASSKIEVCIEGD